MSTQLHVIVLFYTTLPMTSVCVCTCVCVCVCMCARMFVCVCVYSCVCSWCDQSPELVFLCLCIQIYPRGQYEQLAREPLKENPLPGEAKTYDSVQVRIKRSTSIHPVQHFNTCILHVPSYNVPLTRHNRITIFEIITGIREYIMVLREALREARVVYRLWWSKVIICAAEPLALSTFSLFPTVTPSACCASQKHLHKCSQTLCAVQHAFVSHTFRHWGARLLHS